MSSIPTTYNGIRFRSRLEAKWAVFFDHLGWRWHYEPLDCNGWIPDFLIETKTLPILVEVKPILKIDLAVVRKIEKACGLDLTSLWGDMPGGTGDYHYLICGLGPFDPGPDSSDDYAIGWLSDYIFAAEFLPAVVTLTDDSRWGLTTGMEGAWSDRVLDIHGKESRAWVGSDYLDPFWAAACNETQWKKPPQRKRHR